MSDNENDIIWLASFDIGKKNFAFYIEEINLKQLKDIENISVADIRSELFEGENIVIGKTDYGQSQLKSGPFVKKDD